MSAVIINVSVKSMSNYTSCVVLFNSINNDWFGKIIFFNLVRHGCNVYLHLSIKTSINRGLQLKYQDKGQLPAHCLFNPKLELTWTYFCPPTCHLILTQTHIWTLVLIKLHGCLLCWTKLSWRTEAGVVKQKRQVVTSPAQSLAQHVACHSTVPLMELHTFSWAAWWTPSWVPGLQETAQGPRSCHL